ncbi:isoprenyl transferase [Chelatococcus reniformis]|nr:isoprenyl transferase [Chelatococcus reniformis]
MPIEAASDAAVLSPPAPAQETGGVDAPAHVAIIMDGNGRWAERRGLPRAEGHRRGVEALRRTVRAAIELNLRYLTVYSFSSENWRRPAAEVFQLMNLLRLFFRSDLADLQRNNVRVRFIGAREDLASDIRSILEEAERRTAGGTGLNLVIAFNYGGRQELVRAARALALDVAAGRLPADAIDQAALDARLDTAGIPDPDLVIRTSGELRVSNFLLWQAAYAEFVFTPVLWPDFDRATLEAAIADFRGRDRRFGGLGGAG